MFGRRHKPDAPDQGTPTYLQPLTYAPLPWNTHPIDTTPDAPQGWGPYNGPWSPQDFGSPAMAVNIYWTQGDNDLAGQLAPGYDELTLYQDNSLDMVNNAPFLGGLVPAVEAAALSATSTISNVVSKSALGRFRSAVGLSTGADDNE